MSLLLLGLHLDLLLLRLHLGLLLLGLLLRLLMHVWSILHLLKLLWNTKLFQRFLDLVLCSK